jgi:hypothetical protein
MTDLTDLKMVDDIIIDSPDDRDYMFEDYIEQEQAD